MPLSPRTLRPANTFTPRSISGLALWLDASQSGDLFQDVAATIPAVNAGDPVGYWRDRSGNGRHATQGTSGRRPVAAAGASGRRTLAFTGAATNSNALTIPTYPSGDSGQLFTVFLVARETTPTASVGTRTVMGYIDAGGGFRLAVNMTGSGGVANFYPSASSGFMGVPGTSTYLYSITKEDTFATYAIRFNSALGQLTNVPGVGTYSQKLTGVNYGLSGLVPSIGASGGGVNGLTGQISEVIAYTRALSDSERLRIDRYLAAKWGITLAPQVSNADAQDWINRVYANGSTVSATTAAAVNTFCDAINNAGIRERFYRMNIFAGGAGSSDTTRLNACLVPLYRGPSVSNTFGNVTDTNNGAFSSGDYREDASGGPGGLKGNGSRWLDTGLAGNTFSAGDRHCSAYWTENATLTGNRVFIGNSDAASNAAWFDIHSRAPSVGSEAQITSNYPLTHTTANRWQLAQYVGTDSAESYSDGADKKTRATFPLGSPTASTTNWFVFGISPSLFSGVRTDARIAFYSIGLSIPENKILPFYQAVQAFQSALGRSV